MQWMRNDMIASWFLSEVTIEMQDSRGYFSSLQHIEQSMALLNLSITRQDFTVTPLMSFFKKIAVVLQTEVFHSMILVSMVNTMVS